MQTIQFENLYDYDTLRMIKNDAHLQLSTNARTNKVGNMFALSTAVSKITHPLEQFGCSHWYVAYFQHIIGVYPHTDNDVATMKIIGIVPLIWETSTDTHTLVYQETSTEKIILKSRQGLTLDFDFVWQDNCGVFFDANKFHGSDEFTGTKTGIQIIGYT